MESKIKNWNIENDKLIRDFSFENFIEAIRFVNSIAKVAQNMNHHPDIYIFFNKVKLTLFTHSENKITDKDYQLAEKINGL